MIMKLMSKLWIIWNRCSKNIVRIVDNGLKSDDNPENERNDPRNYSECFGNVSCNSHFRLPAEHHPKVKQRAVEIGDKDSADDLQKEGRENCGDGEQGIVEQHQRHRNR